MAFIDVADIGNLDVRRITIAQTSLENLFRHSNVGKNQFVKFKVKTQ